MVNERLELAIWEMALFVVPVLVFLVTFFVIRGVIKVLLRRYARPEGYAKHTVQARQRDNTDVLVLNLEETYIMSREL